MENSSPSPGSVDSEPSDYEKLRNLEADKREKYKTWAEITKAMGAVCIPIVLFLANCQLQQRTERRNAVLDNIAKDRENRQISLEMQNSREASEAQMKANMFAKLLEQYESRAIAVDPQQKLFFLELLVYNFGDSLDLSPIINDVLLDARDAGTLSEEVVKRLAKALREAGSRQVAMLRNASGGLVYATKLQIGRKESFELLHCQDSNTLPIQHILHITLDSLEDDKKIKDIRVANITLQYDDISGKNPYIQKLSVESTDLPLIDNTPLRNGYRFSIISNPTGNEDKEDFKLVLFTQELASIRDKPIARDYIRFLDNTINPSQSGVKANVSCEKGLGNSSIAIKKLS